MGKRELLARLEKAESDALYWHSLYLDWRREYTGALKAASNKIVDLEKKLTIARRNLASEENKHKQESLYRSLHDQRELEELRHQNMLLRDLITSQGAVISEVFNR